MLTQRIRKYYFKTLGTNKQSNAPSPLVKNTGVGGGGGVRMIKVHVKREMEYKQRELESSYAYPMDILSLGCYTRFDVL